MIRVIYRWRVKLGSECEFRRAWEKGTRAILESVDGSHGSLLVRCVEKDSEFAGIARWESVAAWRAALKRRPWPPDPEAAQIVHAVAGRTISIEVFEEEADFTVV